jgi:alkylation response protein AidB-like acyl-CoA dehydrogenase
VDLIKQAEKLVPLLRETAREAETNRKPLDHVIDAIRESGLFSLMVPKQYGGHEADLDVFFDVVLTLSRADASMGWITGFYIEHNLWLFNYGADVCAKVLERNNHVLAGGLVMDESTGPVPTFFLMPKSDVEPIDTWHVNGMCATGSWDFKIDDVFVPENHALPFQQFLDATSGIAQRYSGPLYSTPLMPVLGFAASLPILGAAQMALAEFSDQMRQKIENNVLRAGSPLPDVSGVIGEAALKIDTAELVLRDVMADVMAKRNKATNAERAYWLSRMAYAVYTCKEAALRISEETGASGGFLSNPIQRAVRDISIATNHVVFSKTGRYGDVGKAMLGQDATNARVC